MFVVQAEYVIDWTPLLIPVFIPSKNSNTSYLIPTA